MLNTTCTVRRDEGILILQPKGYLNEEGNQVISEIMAKISLKGVDQLIFNMSECTHINSAGISGLINVTDVLFEKDISVSFCHLTPFMRNAFRMVGLVLLTTIFETEEEAIKKLGENKLD